MKTMYKVLNHTQQSVKYINSALVSTKTAQSVLYTHKTLTNYSTPDEDTSSLVLVFKGDLSLSYAWMIPGA